MLTKVRYSVKDSFFWPIGETLIFTFNAGIIIFLNKVLGFTFLDTPISTISREIEIDMRQMLDVDKYEILGQFSEEKNVQM